MPGLNDFEEIAASLAQARTVAVVGCSPDPARPSNGIARYLVRAGYDVIPVNPEAKEALGRRCYPSLAAIPEEIAIDIVDVFRRSEYVAGIADEAIGRGVRFFWMQDGVVDEDAARRLRDAGIGVAMDRCIYRDRETVGRGLPLA